MLHCNFDQEFLVEVLFEVFDMRLLIRIFLDVREEHVNQRHLFLKESDQGIEEGLKEVCS